MTLQLSLLKREWADSAEPVILEKMRGTIFTTDDLHSLLPTPDHPNWFGILMASLKNKGLVERVGYQPSRRPESNGRAIAVWRII